MKMFAAWLVSTFLWSSLAFGGTSAAPTPQSSDSPIPCDLDVKWVNTSENTKYSRSSQSFAAFTLLAHKGTSCGSADVSLTATYLTEGLDLICTGTIIRAMSMTAPVQSFNLELRPFTQLDFVRWRNEPGIRGTQQGKALTCLNIDGSSDVGDTDRMRAGWIRLAVGIMPSRTGLAVTEVLLRIVP